MTNMQLIDMFKNNTCGTITIKDDESNITFDGKKFIDFENLSIGRNKDEIKKYNVYENTKKKLNYIVISNDMQNKYSMQITVINSYDNKIWTINRLEILEECNYLGELNSIEKEKLNDCIKKYCSK